MNAVPKLVVSKSVPARRPAYDPNNLSPMDIEDRRYDDLSEGIDWDEIIATTQDDWDAGRYEMFLASDYPTDEALMEALERSTDAALAQK